jgi:L-ascorbate metabolism protein UlaG (beta-lactamase superfamily)
MSVAAMEARLTHIGAATLLLELGGLRLLTDPAFDRTGTRHTVPRPVPGLFNSRRSEGPALGADRIEGIDAVLLSHEHHFDNLDDSGRELLPSAGTVLTTKAGAKRLGGNAVGLAPGDGFTVEAGGGALEVTAMPARHGPPVIGQMAGPVIGFLLRHEQLERPVWLSGDTRWYGAVRDALSANGPIGTAIVNLGAARFRPTGPARYTMDAREAAGAVREIGAEQTIPIHFEGWSHFKQGREAARREFERAGIAERVRWLERGEPTEVEL